MNLFRLGVLLAAASVCHAQTPKVSVLVRPDAPSGVVDDEDQQWVNAQLNQQNDARGHQWSFNNGYGGIDEGSNDCFDGALRLMVNNQHFTAQRCQVSANQRVALYFNPSLSGLEVTRRLSIDSERGAVHFLESFTNRLLKPQHATVVLTTSLGTNAAAILADDGATFTNALDPKHRGIMSVGQNNRPSVVFLLNGPGASINPTVQVASNRNVTAIWEFDIAAGQTVSLYHVVAQRPTGTAEVRTFDEFYKRRLIEPHITRSRRDTVANFRMGGGADGEAILLQVDERVNGLGFERSDQDHVVLKEDTLVAGRVRCESLTVETAFGPAKIGWDDVAMLVGGADRDRPMAVHLRSGEVLIGRVQSEGLGLDGGVAMDLSPGRLDVIVAHRGPHDRAGPDDGVAFVRLTNGSRIAAGADNKLRLRGLTLWGAVDFPFERIFAVERQSEPRVGHWVYLDDGSRIGVMLIPEPVTLATARFGEVRFAQIELDSIYRIARVPDPDAEPDSDSASIRPDPADRGALGVCELIGDNRIVGSIDLPHLHVLTDRDNVDVPMSRVKTIEMSEGDGPIVLATITLDDNTVVSGRLGHASLPVVGRDKTWRIPVAHLISYTCGEKPAAPPTDAPSPTPAPEAAPTPAASRP